jgi:outer membrane protein assembly factor BamB
VSRRYLVVAAVFVLLAVAGGVAGWLWYEHATAPREVRGSSTVEFVTTEPPGTERRPRAVVGRVPWPTYGYDDQRTHLSPFAHRPPYRRLWMARTGHYLEYPPTVGYGLVYVSNLTGHFMAIDPETGKTEWQKRLRYCSAASPTLAVGLVFAVFVPRPCSYGPRSRPGAVLAMTAKRGKVVWRRKLASESTPLAVGRLLYLGAWDHRVYALYARTGRVAWSYETDGEVNSSPAYSDGTIYVGTSAGSLYALDSKTGRLRWRARSFSRFAHGREYFYATPTVAYGRVYASNTDGTVYAFGAATGHLLWAKHAGTYVYTAPAVWRKRVYVGTYDGRFYALDAATGDVRWVWTAPGSIHGAPTVMDGLVYFATCGTCGRHGSRYAKLGPRGTFALDALTGKLVWRFPDGHYSPVVADRTRVYVAGSTRVYALKPVGEKTTKQRVRPRARPRSAATPGTTSGRPAR